MIPSFRWEVEQNRVTVHVMLIEDQHATTQAARGDKFEWFVLSSLLGFSPHDRVRLGGWVEPLCRRWQGCGTIPPCRLC